MSLPTLSTPVPFTEHFGPYGGCHVPEPLLPPLRALEAAFREAISDPAFRAEYRMALATFTGRPTPLDPAPRLSQELGFPVLLKREDLNHTGAHKINNTLGQVLLAKRMGCTRILAETGAGQHGVATAAVAARYGLACEIHMGEEDMRRQAPNVRRMELMGAKVIPARTGNRTLRDAVDSALGAFVADPQAFYLLGSAVGPHPYPSIVRAFQSVIGEEARRQCLELTGALPRMGVACVGGGSNAIGLFSAFLDDAEVELVGVEAAGEGLDTPRHAATLTLGRPGILHGSYSYLVQDAEGNVPEVHSISPGLDYPGVGPEHAHLKDRGRVRYEAVTDEEALEAFETLSRLEGIIPAFESSHALAFVLKRLPRGEGGPVLINLSGRGDKDLDEYFRLRRKAVGPAGAFV